MEYRILSAIRAWAVSAGLNPKNNGMYRASIARLILAIDEIQKFH